MSTSVVRSHPDELLAWYVNGTLRETDVEAVDSHLRDCTQCASEIAFLKLVAKTEKARVCHSPGEFGLRRLQSGLDRTVPPEEKQVRRFWRPTMAAAVVLVAVLQASILLKSPSPVVSYATLSGPSVQVDIQIRFAETATQREINALLRSRQLRIVAGPSAAGIYRLYAGTVSGRSIEDLVRELKENRKLVAYVASE